jgi:hypothetical protein
MEREEQISKVKIEMPPMEQIKQSTTSLDFCIIRYDKG